MDPIHMKVMMAQAGAASERSVEAFYQGHACPGLQRLKRGKAKMAGVLSKLRQSFRRPLVFRRA